MKRFSMGLVAGLLVGLMVGSISLVYAYTPIRLLINGNYVQCDVPPQMINDRVMVPASYIATALGATVLWDDANQTVIINGSGYVAPTGNSPVSGVKTPPLTIEQLPVDITINKPDSIGNVYMDAVFKNNSNKNIVGFQITVLLKDSNQKTYLMTYDTVLPGETSPKFTSFGPKTQNKGDIEFIEYKVTIANNDGSKTYLTYDPKLKTYEWN